MKIKIKLFISNAPHCNTFIIILNDNLGLNTVRKNQVNKHTHIPDLVLFSISFYQVLMELPVHATLFCRYNA